MQENGEKSTVRLGGVKVQGASRQSFIRFDPRRYSAWWRGRSVGKSGGKGRHGTRRDEASSHVIDCGAVAEGGKQRLCVSASQNHI